MELTDAELISRSVNNPEQFAVIFERHFDEVHRYLRRRYPQVAEDLATETFAVAFAARAKFVAHGDSARPWLYGIASNLLAKQWRGERRALRAHARAGALMGVDDGGSGDEFAAAAGRVDATRRSAQVAAALAQLKAADRDTILLYALAELSYEEIAEAQSIPVGTVRSRLARARRICAGELGVGAAGDQASGDQEASDE